MTRPLFDRIVRWFTLSSSNPTEVGMTMKAAFVGALPVIMFAVGMTHWNIGVDQLTQLFDMVVLVVQDALILIAGVMGVVGFCRKLAVTLVGSNNVNAPQAFPPEQVPIVPQPTPVE